MTEDFMTSREAFQKLLPHGSGMIFLQGLVSYSDTFVECETIAGAGKEPRDAAGNIPPVVGLEYMAQAAAVLAGIRASRHGALVQQGLLLGSRNISCAASSFIAGERLRVRAELEFDGGEVHVFDCCIRNSQGAPLLWGRLNIYLRGNSAATERE